MRSERPRALEDALADRPGQRGRNLHRQDLSRRHSDRREREAQSARQFGAGRKPLLDQPPLFRGQKQVNCRQPHERKEQERLDVGKQRHHPRDVDARQHNQRSQKHERERARVDRRDERATSHAHRPFWSDGARSDARAGG